MLYVCEESEQNITICDTIAMRCTIVSKKKLSLKRYAQMLNRVVGLRGVGENKNGSISIRVFNSPESACEFVRNQRLVLLKFKDVEPPFDIVYVNNRLRWVWLYTDNESLSGIGDSFTIPACIDIVDKGYGAESRVTPDHWSVNVKHLIIEDGVKEIDKGAFHSAKQLSDFKFPSSLSVINSRAFSKSDLTDVTIQGTIKAIDGFAFRGCTQLQSVDIQFKPDSVAVVGLECFSDCSSLVSVRLENVKCIERGAFYYCRRLADVSLGNDLQVICRDCFACNAIQKIVLPESLTELQDRAFIECVKLEEVVIGAKDFKVGLDCFSGCSSLKTIVLPEDCNKDLQDALRRAISLNRRYDVKFKYV